MPKVQDAIRLLRAPGYGPVVLLSYCRAYFGVHFALLPHSVSVHRAKTFSRHSAVHFWALTFASASKIVLAVPRTLSGRTPAPATVRCVFVCKIALVVLVVVTVVVVVVVTVDRWGVYAYMMHTNVHFAVSLYANAYIYVPDVHVHVYAKYVCMNVCVHVKTVAYVCTAVPAL